MTSFEDFQRMVTVLLGREAADIRANYINRFVDSSSEYFHKYIATTRQFRDGLCYHGYLWDSLKQRERVPESSIFDKNLLNENVYVLWDIHSAEKIFIEDYWKFPKESVLSGRYGDLLSGIEYLPEDLYICDEQMNWSLILTHEYDNAGERVYYRAS